MSAEFALVNGYLGVFALALFVCGRRGSGRMVIALGAGAVSAPLGPIQGYGIQEQVPTRMI